MGSDANVRGTVLGLTLSGGVLVGSPLFVELCLMFGDHVLLVLSGDCWGDGGSVLSG